MERVHLTIQATNSQRMMLTREAKDIKEAIDIAFEESGTLLTDAAYIEIEDLDGLE